MATAANGLLCRGRLCAVQQIGCAFVQRELAVCSTHSVGAPSQGGATDISTVQRGTHPPYPGPDSRNGGEFRNSDIYIKTLYLHVSSKKYLLFETCIFILLFTKLAQPFMF